VKPQHHELPMLAGIAGLIRWVEELVNLISGPLLTLGLGIALIDLLTEGRLLNSVPLLLYAWAVSQAVGVDAQLVATFDRAHTALRERRLWALVGLLLLGAILAYVAWIASQVFALQQSEGITTAAALSRLGMDPALWLIQRTALSVFLVCLAGWTRYHPPAKNVALDAQAEREKLQAALDLEPMRQQLRAQQMRGVRTVMAAAIGRETPERPPTGGGSPARRGPASTGVRTPNENAAQNVVRLPSPSSRPRRGSARKDRASQARRPMRTASVEPLVRSIWTPGMSASELQKRSAISRSAASKWRSILEAEQAAQAHQAAQ
jgi:hypothetical protein